MGSDVCTCGLEFFPSSPEAALTVSPVQSVWLCQLKPVVGGIWAGTAAPLKSFSPARQSGTKARVQRNT